jgi:LysM repeat protein
MFGDMKRFGCWVLVFALLAVATARAQDAATEERLNKLSGQIEDLIAGQKALQQQLTSVAREVAQLRDQAANKPVVDYASAEDVKRLSDAVREIDRKRLDDYEKIRGEIIKLGNVVTAPPARTRSHSTSTAEPSGSDKPVRPEAGFEYIVEKGDALSVIVQRVREKGIKVSMDQVLKANPGLNAENIRVGQKLFIPAP